MPFDRRWLNSFMAFEFNDTDLQKITKTEVVGLQKLKWLNFDCCRNTIPNDKLEMTQCVQFRGLIDSDFSDVKVYFTRGILPLFNIGEGLHTRAKATLRWLFLVFMFADQISLFTNTLQMSEDAGL